MKKFILIVMATLSFAPAYAQINEANPYATQVGPQVDAYYHLPDGTKVMKTDCMSNPSVQKALRTPCQCEVGKPILNSRNKVVGTYTQDDYDHDKKVFDSHSAIDNNTPPPSSP